MPVRPKLTEEEIAEFERLLSENKNKVKEKKKRRLKVTVGRLIDDDPNKLTLEEAMEKRVERELASFISASGYIKTWADAKYATSGQEITMLIADAVEEINDVIRISNDKNVRLMKAQGFAVHIDRFHEYYLKYAGLSLGIGWHAEYRRPIRVITLNKENMLDDYDPIEDRKKVILQNNTERYNNEARRNPED